MALYDLNRIWEELKRILNVAVIINGSKTTPVDADTIALKDSTDNVWKTLTFANLWIWVGTKIGLYTKEATGFVSPELVVITANGDRTITITGTATAIWRHDIVPTLASGYTSPAHGTDITKTYYLSYDGSSIAWSETVWTFDKIQICIAKYTNFVGGGGEWRYMRESHGLMTWQSHEELHQTIGTYVSAGGTIPSASYVLSSTTATNRRPDIDATTVKDEDLQTVNPALTSKSYTQAVLESTGTNAFVNAASDIVPLSTNQPYYNSFSTPNWGQTLFPANSVGTIWVYSTPAASDSASQKYRYMFVQPQWITQAQGAAAQQITDAVNVELLRSPSELNLGTLTIEEIVCIGRIVIAYTGGNWSIKNVSRITGNKFSQIGSPSGNYLSIVATDASLTGSGTTGSPLVVVQNYELKDNTGYTADTPLDADTFSFWDVVDSVRKKITFANLKAAVGGGDFLPLDGSEPMTGTLTTKSGSVTEAPIKIPDGDFKTVQEAGLLERSGDKWAMSIDTPTPNTTYTTESPSPNDNTTVKSTTVYNDPFALPHLSTGSNSLTGVWYPNVQWISNPSVNTNQRFHIDLGEVTPINRIYYENSHSSGTVSNYGAKNFTLWGSNSADSFNELTYANNTGWTQITGLSQSFFDEHIASDVADPKYITIAETASYRYYAFKIADNYGGAFMGIRRLQLQYGEAQKRRGVVLDDGTDLTERTLPIASSGGRLIDSPISLAESSDTTDSLNLTLEQQVEAIGTFTPSHKLKIKINGTWYHIQLDAI